MFVQSNMLHAPAVYTSKPPVKKCGCSSSRFLTWWLRSGRKMHWKQQWMGVSFQKQFGEKTSGRVEMFALGPSDDHCLFLGKCTWILVSRGSSNTSFTWLYEMFTEMFLPTKVLPTSGLLYDSVLSVALHRPNSTITQADLNIFNCGDKLSSL